MRFLPSRLFPTALLLLLCVVTAKGELTCADSPLTLADAMAYCDSHALTDLEGVWAIAGDEDTQLQILRDSECLSQPLSYRVVVISSSDVMVPPGVDVGALKATADGKRFHLSLTKSPDENGAGKMQSLALELSSDKRHLKINKRELKLRLNPLAMLPYLRSILRIDMNNGVKNLPEGFVKLYPAGEEVRYF